MCEHTRRYDYHIHVYQNIYASRYPNNTKFLTMGTQDAIFELPDPPTTIFTAPSLSTTMVGQAVDTERFPGSM